MFKNSIIKLKIDLLRYAAKTNKRTKIIMWNIDGRKTIAF